MPLSLPICIGPNALDRLVAFVEARDLQRFYLVADGNTWRALGAKVERALTANGKVVTPIILKGRVIADEEQIMQVLLAAEPEEWVYLAVGSGTITDIIRFISHRTSRPFISLPTAPSVDAYASINAPLVVRRLKQTVQAQMPLAIFADLETLCQAPPAMIAAGFGDMLAKYTCLADWQLGDLLWDECYDAQIAEDARKALRRVTERVDEIGARQPEGIRVLIEALVASGLAMARLGNSSPASGSEHHLSHYWEIKLLQENRPAILHGAKVGVGALLMAHEYERMRALTREQMLARLEVTRLPDPEEQKARIRAAYGPIAEQVIEKHRAFLDMSPERFADLQRRIADRWDRIQAIAASVPTEATLADLLRRAGGVTTPKGLGLGPEKVDMALQSAHAIRNRFTVRKLEIALGMTIQRDPHLI